MLAPVVHFSEIWLQIAIKFLNARILILKIHIDKEIHSHRDIQTKRHTDKETYRQRDIQTKRHTDTKKEEFKKNG